MASSSGILDFPTRDGAQRIRLAALPFVHQNRFLDEFRSPETATRDYAAHLREIQAELARGLLDGFRADHDVLLFAAHLYVEGTIPSYSERPVDIADTYATAPEALPPVSYGALGHIHKPQSVGRAGFTARYAGSPLQMDFGEAGEDESIVLVEADPSGPTFVDVIPPHSGRGLVEFTGTLAQLRARAEQIDTAFVKAIIDTETPTRHPAEAVAEVLPRATIVRVEERCAASQVEVLDSAAVNQEEPELPELFRAYLAKVGTPNMVAADVLATFEDLLAMVDDERPQSTARGRAAPHCHRGTLNRYRGDPMRPLQLSFSGMRSYTGRCGPLDFTGKSLIGVLGDTGAGKSTIAGSDHLRPVRQRLLEQSRRRPPRGRRRHGHDRRLHIHARPAALVERRPAGSIARARPRRTRRPGTRGHHRWLAQPRIERTTESARLQ